MIRHYVLLAERLSKIVLQDSRFDCGLPTYSMPWDSSLASHNASFGTTSQGAVKLGMQVLQGKRRYFERFLHLTFYPYAVQRQNHFLFCPHLMPYDIDLHLTKVRDRHLEPTPETSSCYNSAGLSTTKQDSEHLPSIHV